MLNSKKILEFTKVAITVAVLTIGTGYALANFTAPRYSPPTCPTGDPGCDAPINVSKTSQVKTGGLGIGAAFSTKGKTILAHGQNDPVIADNLRVKVYGRVGAKAYCDEEGNNCIVPGTVTGGGGGEAGTFSFTCPKGQALSAVASDGSFDCVKTGFSISLPDFPDLPGPGDSDEEEDTRQCYDTVCSDPVISCKAGYFRQSTQTCTNFNQAGKINHCCPN